MKALFVIHESKFVYGSNRSIAELLGNIDYDFDVMICKSFTRKVDEKEIREMLGKHLQKIYICWLPRYRCYFYNTIGVISELSHLTNNFMALIYSHKRKKIIRQGGYDYVHLNSMVLFPMIDDKDVYIMHVREIINPNYYNVKKLRRKMEDAEGIIYIDEATHASLQPVYAENRAITLNNPFSMLSLAKIDYKENLKKYGLTEDNTIFALLGQVTEVKGAEFVIRSFIKTHNDKSRLMIIGEYNHSYGRECRKIAKDDKRIIFCGELKDTRGIYRISDYIIRGDSQFCIGRTIFEGLYAGAGVIIPGCSDDLMNFPDGKKFEEKIFFYTPRKESDLTDVIERRSQAKQTDRELHSNIEDYVKNYYQYISKIIGICEEQK